MRRTISYLRQQGYTPLADELRESVASSEDIQDLAKRIRDKLPEIERREQKIIDLFDLWISKGTFSKRSLKIAFTKYLASCKDIIKFKI